MAETFNNGDTNLSIRIKLNANAEEINTHEEEITSLETEKAPINNPTFTGTVAGVTKGMVGLGNVDNTTDLNKPISSATQTALEAKAPIASPTFTGTVGGITKAMVGLGSVDNTADASKPVSSAQATAIGLKVDKTTTVNSKALSTNITLDKTDIGLSNVDNTSDANKPVSNAAALILNSKADLNEEGEVVSGQLPDVGLSALQFEQLTIDDVLQPITIKDTWLVNKIIEVGIAQGWGTLVPLAAPVMTFGTSTDTENVINWTRPTNGVTSELQVLVSAVWTPLYSGINLSFTHTGLTAETTYDYRVRALADGFAPSPYDEDSKTTAAGGGGGTLVQTVKLRMGVNTHGALPTGWGLWLANGPGNTSPIDNTEGDDAGFLVIDMLSTDWSEELAGVPTSSDPDFPDTIVEYVSYNTNPGTTKTIKLTGCTVGNEYEFTFGIMFDYENVSGAGTKVIMNGVEKGTILVPGAHVVYKNSPYVVTPTVGGEIVIDFVPAVIDDYAGLCGVIIKEYTV